MKRFLAIFAVLLAALVLRPADARGKEGEQKPVLVCSTTQIGDFVRQIVGDRAVVKTILAPGADPHTYMPTPQDAKMVLGADLCLQNGLHLEGKNWMATLARDAEQAGWDGFFIWDHIARDYLIEVVDPWVSLAAIAMASSPVIGGAMFSRPTNSRLGGSNRIPALRRRSFGSISRISSLL